MHKDNHIFCKENVCKCECESQVCVSGICIGELICVHKSVQFLHCTFWKSSDGAECESMHA